jgi:molecular chaperone DnaK
MVEQAKAHEAEDKQRRELIDLKNGADNLGYQTEKTLKELGDKVSEGDRKDIEEKVEALKKAAEGDDTASIKAATEDLQNAFNAISEQLYQQEQTAQQAPPAEDAGEAAPADDDVIEGEVTEE